MGIKVYGRQACPNCDKIKKMLEEKNIKFDYIEDMETAITLGRENKIMSLPICVVDGSVLDFNKTKDYINGVV